MTAPVSRDAAEHQRLVDAHFRERAEHWKALYGEETLWGVVHQERRRRTLQWIDELGLAAGSRVLEVGCGAGLLAIDLARRGLAVECIDVNDAMVELARREAAEAGLGAAITPRVGDAHALAFDPGAFQLVVALGVLPFLHTPPRALAEMARVTAAGGSLLFSSDNRWRLNHVLDPRFTPLLAPLRAAVGAALAAVGRDPRAGRMPAHLFPAAHLRALCRGAGFEIVRLITLGFGPFSLLGRTLLAETPALRIHHRLQALGDRGVPLLRATGAQHLLLARRTA